MTLLGCFAHYAAAADALIVWMGVKRHQGGHVVTLSDPALVQAQRHRLREKGGRQARRPLGHGHGLR